MSPEEIQTQTAGQRAWQGASTALLLVILFIIQLGAMGMDYGAWVLWPLGAVSVGGALGGLFYYLLEPVGLNSNRKKWLVNTGCALVYIFILWLSLVAALSVTGHWN